MEHKIRHFFFFFCCLGYKIEIEIPEIFENNLNVHHINNLFFSGEENLT